MGLAALATLLASSCVLGPDFQRPTTQAGDGYARSPSPSGVSTGEDPAAAVWTRAGAAASTAATRPTPVRIGADVPAQWWKVFGSTRLDAQVEAALAGNPSLQAAAASLRQSQDLLRAGNGVFYPQASLAGSLERERSTSTQLGPAQSGPGTTPSIFNLYTLGASVSYTLDLFGAERRTVEGLQSNVAYQFYLGEAAWLTLSANVVNTNIARAAYVAETRATEDLIGLEREQVRIATVSWQTGYLSYAVVLTLRSQLAASEAALAPLRQKISTADHLLATLQGASPAAEALPGVALDELVLPQDLPLSLPSALLRQRPDVLSAEATLHASSAAIGVATAALFPRITLDGSYGAAATRFAGLALPEQRFWTIGPGISVPLFNGGALHAQLDAARDSEMQFRALYRQTVLAAFAQVADVLAALQHDAESLQALTDARDAACGALALQQAGYASGLVAWSDVLIVDAQCQQAAIARIDAVAQREQDSVALFMALGGGWWNDPARAAAAPLP